MDIPFFILAKNEKDIRSKISKAIEIAVSKNQPFVFLIKKGNF